jgi:hypothetical protein
VDRTNPIPNLRDIRDSIEQYAPPSDCHSRIARTRSDFYEALAPLGLPGSERQCAEYGGWSNRVLRAIGIGSLLGL